MKNKSGGTSPKFKKAVNAALRAAVPDEMSGIKEMLGGEGIKDNNTNGIAAAMVLKALKGDLSAANWVKDTVKEEGEQAENAGVIIITGEGDLPD